MSETAVPVDLRGSASRLIESSSQLAVKLDTAQQAAAVEVFVRSYTEFHTAVTQSIQQQPVSLIQSRSVL